MKLCCACVRSERARRRGHLTPPGRQAFPPAMNHPSDRPEPTDKPEQTDKHLQTDRRERLAFARTIAREAGAIALRHFGASGLVIESKADRSPVTNADRESELHLRACIGAAFPDDAILGEEFPEVAGRSGYRWILDPIDGTRAFVHGVPFFGTMVGVERAGRSVAGVVYFPALKEEIWASEGDGSWFLLAGEAEPRRARVSKVERLEDALFLSTDVDGFEAIGALEVHERMRHAVRLSRGWNDCYAYYMVATGRADLVVDPKMQVWDCAALQPILEEAGGRFTDWDGASTIWASRTIGANRALHEEAVALIRAASGSAGSKP